MRWIVGSLALAAAIVGWTASGAGQTTFGEDIRVTNAANSSTGPQFAFDSGGDLHVVWTDQRAGRAEIFYTKLDNDGNTLIPDFKVNNTLTDLPYAPHVAVDGNDDVHIIWTDRRDGNNEIYYQKQDVSGAVLVDDLRVTNNTAFTEPEGLGIDPSGNVNIVFEDKRDGNFEIYYKKLDSVGNEIVPDTRISNNSSFSQDAALTIDIGGTCHIVWQDYRNNNQDLYYSNVDPLGSIVVSELQLTTDPADSEAVDIFVDNFGDLHMVWQDSRDGNYEIYYMVTDTLGAIVLPAQRLTTDPSTSLRPRVALNSKRETVVAWRDNREGNAEIFLKKLGQGGVTLQDDTRVTDDPGQSTAVVLGIDGSDEPHFVWEDDRAGNIEIFTKRAFRCKTGTANAGAGDVKPVLFINGQIGDLLSRTVTVPAGNPISVAIQKPPAGGNGSFVVHADAGAPLGVGQTKLPSGVGTTCFPFLLPPTGTANPAGVWNSIGFAEIVGSSQYLDGTPIPDPDPAPTVIVSQILGDTTVLPVGTQYTFQGIIKDPGSSTPKLASTTNAVILKIL